MTINLYKNSSDIIEVNKSINEVLSLTGTIKEGTSFTTPSILIELSNIEKYYELVDSDDNEIVDDLDDIVDASLITLNDFNYAYITEFKRYYYINDIVVENNRLFRLNMSVDVLMSFKDYYLELDALVSRNEYLYDVKIEDDKMPYEYKLSSYEDDIDYSENDFNFNTNIKATPIPYNYVISYFAVGKLTPSDDDVDGVGNLLPSISYISAGDNCSNQINPMSINYVDTLTTRIADDENIATFIKSLICYPFEIPDVSTFLYQLRLGKNNVSNVFTGRFKDGLVVSPYYKLGTFYITYNNYRDVEPYTTYELYLPYYGYTELKSSDILNNKIDIYYSFDWANGTAKINIVNVRYNYIIKSLSANVGVKISLSRTNNQQLSDERVQLSIKTGLTALSSIASVVGGGITGNPYLIAGGVTGLSNTLIDSSVQFAQMHEKGQTANSSGIEGLYGVQRCRLKVTKYQLKEPTDYAKFYGRPLNQTQKLKALSGYTLVKDIHLDTLPATKNELNELMTLLTAGIIL